MATKKSAARIKPVSNKVIEKPDFEPLEDIFDTIKKSFIMTVETNIVTAKRVDNLASIRDSAYSFWGGSYLDEQFLPGERYRYFLKLQKISVNAYETILQIAKTFTLEEFSKEEMTDYFEDVVPPVDEIGSEWEMLEALIIFKCVQPYGSKMNQIHQMILEEINKRKAYEDK